MAYKDAFHINCINTMNDFKQREEIERTLTDQRVIVLERELRKKELLLKCKALRNENKKRSKRLSKITFQ